jgi:hypothetical protein
MEETKIIAIAALVFTSFYLWKLIRNFRYKTAFKFGKIEHLFARVTFVFLVLTLGLLIFEKEDLALYPVLLAGICWIIYWTSHRLEKWFHPKH